VGERVWEDVRNMVMRTRSSVLIMLATSFIRVSFVSLRFGVKCSALGVRDVRRGVIGVDDLFIATECVILKTYKGAKLSGACRRL
jgi:hypothetical protein